KIPLRKQRRTLFQVRCTDETGVLNLKFFNIYSGLENQYRIGRELVLSGKVKKFRGSAEMIHPEIAKTGSGGEKSTHAGRVIPIYTEIEGISTRILRTVLWNALEKFGKHLQDEIPQHILKKYTFPSLKKSILELHFPSESTSLEALALHKTPYHQRLIFEEFFRFEFLVLRKRMLATKESAQNVQSKEALEAMENLATLLPFELTGDQKKSLQEIHENLCTPHPMNRLIQGDVGSGKTVVAFLSAAMLLAHGSQACLMAPTEILAEQHYKNAIKLFGGRLNVFLITGKTKKSERTKIIGRLISGEPALLIGTHALIEPDIQFRNLDLVMIDEQHRFGVQQRQTLREKGIRYNSIGIKVNPHQLILTATPIPRTLALTAYGDLSVTSIRQKPSGRSPIETQVIIEAKRKSAYEKIKSEISKGRQAYLIYPLVNESEAEGFTDLKSAVEHAKKLQETIFSEYKVGLLHGKMKNDDKSKIMSDFLNQKIHILVSTTVVEVGVDNPNATIIGIEHSERFGLSQLHQLRGRVGRGKYQSFCFLFTSGRLSETGTLRLQALEKSTDGFKIAEMDLEIRGPGEFLGTRQSGSLPFRLANLVRDKDWLIQARESVQSIMKKDPELEMNEHFKLKNFLHTSGVQSVNRLKTS
ncbi:MAG: ATP-dependent DNA helicase RecG, partial [Bdellovibrionaceae bacterium]|nr:ATP-dependent DNA helicase RecG [Pseudobdellovibrionaceae bacterium]